MGQGKPIALKNVFDRKCAQMDSTVTIQDIIVTEPKTGYYSAFGEYNNATADIATQTDRLFQHITNLSELAAQKHRVDYCDEQGELRADKKNNITRLVTNEFLFYTRKPLTLEEFNELRSKIEKLAEGYPDNLHLALSSFSIKTPDNQLINMVLHVECGKQPQIHTFAKNFGSPVDPIYGEFDEKGQMTTKYSYVDHFRNPTTYETIHQQDVPRLILGNGKEMAVSHENVFEISTAGKGKYYLCMDVCLDYKNATAQKSLTQTLEKNANNADENLHAIQSSHLVTAYPIGPHPDNNVGDVTIADPFSPMKMGANFIGTYTLNPGAFGSALNVTYTTAQPCSLLPVRQMRLADKQTEQVYNHHQLERTDSRLQNYILKKLIDIGQNNNMTTVQKQWLAHKTLSQYISSFHSIEDLRNFFYAVNKLKQQTAASKNSLSYLSEGQDQKLKFSSAEQSIVNLIYNQAIEITEASYDEDNPFIDELQEYKNKFIIPTQKSITSTEIDSAIEENEHDKIDEWLSSHSVNTTIANGDFPLHTSIMFSNIGIMKLIEKGANVNVKNALGETPLEIAMKLGRQEIIEQLLFNGADPNLITSSGDTPLTLAVRNKQYNLIPLLLYHGANINQRNQHRQLPIEVAYLSNDPYKYSTMKSLISCGAKLNVTINGTYLLDYAMKQNDPELIQLCMNHTSMTPREFTQANTRKQEILSKTATPPNPGVTATAVAASQHEKRVSFTPGRDSSIESHQKLSSQNNPALDPNETAAKKEAPKG